MKAIDPPILTLRFEGLEEIRALYELADRAYNVVPDGAPEEQLARQIREAAETTLAKLEQS